MEDFHAHFEEFIKDIHKDMHVVVRLGYEGAIYVPPKSSIVTSEKATAGNSTDESAQNSGNPAPDDRDSPAEATNSTEPVRKPMPQHQSGNPCHNTSSIATWCPIKLRAISFEATKGTFPVSIWHSLLV
jgi:hypothetical protein